MSEWESKLREALKLGGLSKCDVNAVDCYVLAGEPSQYDIVLSSMCLEAACTTYQSFKATIQRLSRVLKEGGFLVLVHGRNQNYYTVNGRRFFILSLNEKHVTEALQEAGFIDVGIVSFNDTPDEEADDDGVMVVTAYKSKLPV